MSQIGHIGINYKITWKLSQELYPALQRIDIELKEKMDYLIVEKLLWC